MLRALVALLLLANIGFFAWTQGSLDSVVGVRAAGDREPERLARQVRPETVKILPPNAASSATSSAASATAAFAASAAASAAAAAAEPPPTACLEAGPFAPAQIAAAEAAVQAAVPRGQWSTARSEQPGSWIVYMGRFANREAQAKKEDELKRLKFAYEEVTAVPNLEPGISLGRYAERALADKALAEFATHGVRTARVVEFRASSTLQFFRVEHAELALASRLGTLKVDALGKGFMPCASANVATR